MGETSEKMAWAFAIYLNVIPCKLYLAFKILCAVFVKLPTNFLNNLYRYIYLVDFSRLVGIWKSHI